MTDARQAPGRWLIPVLSAANFVIGMGAFVVIGILGPMADDLGISPARAGWLMTSYAMAYAVFSPVLVSLTGQIGRRRVIAGGMAIFGLASLGAALSPDDIYLNFFRVLTAIGAGIVTPVAAAVAAGLSAPERQGKALARVFFGMTFSQIVGAPVGAWAAYTLGWRSAFVIVVALALPVTILIWRNVPKGLSFRPLGLRDLGQVLIHPAQLMVVGYTAFAINAAYILFTFLSPVMSQTMGFGRAGISAVLLVYGLGAVMGNLIGGALTDRIGPYRTLVGLTVAVMLLLPAFSVLPLPPVVAFALVFVWAAAGWSFMAPQQARLLRQAPEQVAVLFALNAAAIYVGAAFGSAIGSWALDRWGVLSLGLVASAASALALVQLLASRAVARDGDRA